MYFGSLNSDTGGEVWTWDGASTWTQVNQDGFGGDFSGVTGLAEFNNKLYAVASHTAGGGGGLWVCAATTCTPSDWSVVTSDGFGNPNNRIMPALVASGGRLFVVFGNNVTGLQIWMTSNGTTWGPLMVDGFHGANMWTYYSNAVAAFNNSIVVGTSNTETSGQVWYGLMNRQFLPAVHKN